MEQRRRWELVRTELWRGRRLIAVAGAWLLGATAVVVLIPVGSSMARGFVAGALLTSWAWMVYVTSLIRTYPATMGEWRDAAMDGARSSARSVRSILRAQGITDIPVEPVPAMRDAHRGAR